jgi:hypothetical protein
MDKLARTLLPGRLDDGKQVALPDDNFTRVAAAATTSNNKAAAVDATGSRAIPNGDEDGSDADDSSITFGVITRGDVGKLSLHLERNASLTKQPRLARDQIVEAIGTILKNLAGAVASRNLPSLMDRTVPVLFFSDILADLLDSGEYIWIKGMHHFFSEEQGS